MIIRFRVNLNGQELPLHLEELRWQIILGGHLWQVFNDLVHVEFGNVHGNFKLREHAERSLSADSREQDICVSDDAFDRHGSLSPGASRSCLGPLEAARDNYP